MVKKIVSLLIITSMLITLSACGKKKIEEDSNQANAVANNQAKIQVVVSFNAVREFAEAVGKDKVQVRTMVPDGIEPHDFEPKAKDLEALTKAKIFIYNGLGIEIWADKAVKAAKNKDLTVVEASKGFELIKNLDADEIEEHGEFDPHLWLSLKGADNEAKNIKVALVKVDPSNREFYETNYKEFSDKLDVLYKEYYAKISPLTNKTFVTGHAAFAYLCKDFGLKQNSVEDVFSAGEPSARKLKELVDYCKENKIKTIFVEDMVSPKISETLAKEVGSKTEKIYTIESKEDNKDYIQSMRNNLEKIYSSLK